MEWIGGRWHLAGRPIHAGSYLLLWLWLPGHGRQWREVRIESSDHGRILTANITLGGREFVSQIDPVVDSLRWPA